MTFVEHSDSLARIVETVGRSVHALTGRRHAMATAVAWRPGVVVTAAHPFRHPPAAATLIGAGTSGVDATLAGVDAASDLAVYRTAEAAAVEPVATADAAALRAGHVVVAVGRSGDGDLLASAGIVNRVGGPWQSWLGASIDRLIRLDGGVHPGLSGAPVAGADGRVVGIASAALSRHYGIVVPTATVDRVVDALLAGRTPARAWLGIAAQTVPLPARAGTDATAAAAGESGLLVTGLAGGGPAQKAGVLIGDIVVAAAGRPVGDLAALRAALAAHVGREAELDVVRGGEPRRLSIEVGDWPASRRCG